MRTPSSRLDERAGVEAFLPGRPQRLEISSLATAPCPQSHNLTPPCYLSNPLIISRIGSGTTNLPPSRRITTEVESPVSKLHSKVKSKSNGMVM